MRLDTAIRERRRRRKMWEADRGVVVLPEGILDGVAALNSSPEKCSGSGGGGGEAPFFTRRIVGISWKIIIHFHLVSLPFQPCG